MRRGTDGRTVTERVINRAFRRSVPLDASYYLTLDRIHQHVRPRGYVEVGVSRGLALAHVLPGTVAVGVDPSPKLSFPLGKRTRVVRETSDDFFARRDLRAMLDGMPLDLAFVDGMHLFEFALRDFANLERYAHEETTILVHDCYPPDEESARRQLRPGIWTGDVWKLVPTLKRWRPELEVHVVDVAPAGLAVVRGLQPGSTVLTDHYDEILVAAEALDYATLVRDGKDEVLSRVPADWAQVAALLPAAPFRHASNHVLTARRALAAWRGAEVRRPSVASAGA